MAACPKCGEPRRDEPACRACGLAAARMEAYAQARDAAVPGSLRVAWDALIEAWDEPARHDRVLQLTVQHGCYAWTAERYRGVRARRGADATDPYRVASDRRGADATDHYLERIRRAAEAALLVTATRRERTGPQPYRGTTMLLALIVVMIVLGVLYATFVRARGATQGGAPAPPMSQVR